MPRSDGSTIEPAMAVRACRREECPQLLALWREAEATPSPTDSLAALEQILTEPQARVLVAERDGRIVGSVIAAWDGWRGNIYRVAVAPAHRRQGIGQALMRAASAFLRERGASRVTALVEHDHPWAVGFWDSLKGEGYRRDPRIIRYVGTLSPER
jgi:ribosomal protein S18 acetylase RimI-like enzyme